MKKEEEVYNLLKAYSTYRVDGNIWFKKVDLLEASKEIASQFKTVEPEKGWIRFEDRVPEDYQEIMIVWPSGSIPPEYRRWSDNYNPQHWTDMRWIPIPDYAPTTLTTK